MKKTIFFGLIIFLIIGSCTQENKSPIEGAWKLVFGQWTVSDTMKYLFPQDISGGQIKIWSRGYVTFAGQFKIDTIITDSYGAATYTIEGNKYTESILYHDYTAPTGVTAKMLLEIRNDTLVQTYGTDDDWKITASTCCIEKYVRVK